MDEQQKTYLVTEDSDGWIRSVPENEPEEKSAAEVPDRLRQRLREDIVRRVFGSKK
jgi:hypothetical protein